MQVLVNGETRSLPAETRLPTLIEQLKLAERRLAIELNGSIVPRSAWSQTSLRDGDRLEIVHAIGGG